ncbi:DoxX family protein [Staphylococcus canis]|uniref:DoxX family protein n=1 Tax=Staphylococcus canis TaxID=2724942 RepID=A0ABS0TC28_9STAP|nr:hypothetical protein [Staphylococcus canis]MBI5975952.1 hypothetical protein [Staphylococcus canis]
MKSLVRKILGVAFFMIGVLHFTKERQFRNIVPHYLPLRKTAVLITGVCEIVIGILMFMKRPSYTLKHWIIAFLWSVLPANIYMARKELPLGDKQLPKSALYGRIPMQFVLMYIIRKL